MWSWLLHRITGLGVLLFLIVHIVDISLLNFGPNVYNEGISLFGTGIVRVITLALVAALFFHSFNGVRIILIDFWPKAARFQGRMFAIVLAVTILCFIAFGFFILAPIFGVNLGNMPADM